MGINRVIEPTVEPISLDEAKAHARITISDDDSYISNMLIPACRNYAEKYLQRSLISQTWELTLPEFPWTSVDLEIILPFPPIQKVVSITYIDTLGVSQTLTEGTDFTVDLKRDAGRIVPYYSTTWPTTRPVPNAVTIRYQAGYAVPVTVAVEANTLTPTNRTYSNGETVFPYFIGLSGVVPTGLTARNVYYVVNAGSTIQLSATSGGSAIDLTDDGTGQITLGEIPQQIKHALLILISHMYEIREPVITGGANSGTINQVPMSVEALLGTYRVLEFAA